MMMLPPFSPKRALALAALGAYAAVGFAGNEAQAVTLNLTFLNAQTIAGIQNEASCTAREIGGVWGSNKCYYGTKFAALSAMGHLAVEHFNTRNATIVKELEMVDTACGDLNLVARERDTSFSADVAVSETIDVITDTSFKTNVVIGPATSASSIPTSLILGARDVPQISYWATSTELSETKYKRFLRTIPTDADVAKTTCAFWRDSGYNHTAMLYVNDGYGEAYKEAIVAFCSPDITVLTLPFSGEKSAAASAQLSAQLKRLEQSKIRIFLLVSLDGILPTVVREGSELGLFKDSMWLVSDGISSADFAGVELEHRAALNGTLRIANLGAKAGRQGSPPTPWDMLSLKDLNASALPGVQAAWPEVWKGYGNVFASVGQDSAEISDVGAFFYDAVIAAGLGACLLQDTQINDADFGEEFFKFLAKSELGLSFEGLTGTVRFDETGDRDAETAGAAMYNIIYSDAAGAGSAGDDGAIFTAKRVGLFENGTWTFESQLVYTGGTTSRPNDVVVPDEDRNHSVILRHVVNAMGACNVAFAFSLALWTVAKRNHIIIRASQVVFLVCIAVGVMVSSSSIFLIAVDDVAEEGQEVQLSYGSAYATANTACMGSIWFYSVGFTIAFGALFARIWRIRLLFVTRAAFRRVIVPNWHLFMIIATLLAIDVTVLACWTLLDPLTFTRNRISTDEFDNVTESVATCSSDSSLTFLLILGVFHFAILAGGNYISWTCRKINSTFAEARHVALAMWSYVQVLALGIPVMIIVSENSETLMFVKGAIVFLNDFTLLLFLFGPKILGVHFNVYDTSGEGGELFEGFRSDKKSAEGSTKTMGSTQPNAGKEFGNRGVIQTAMTFVPSSLAPGNPTSRAESLFHDSHSGSSVV